MILYGIYLPQRYEWVMSKDIVILLYLALKAGLTGKVELHIINHAGHFKSHRDRYYQWLSSGKVESHKAHEMVIEEGLAYIDGVLYYTIRKPVNRPSDINKI